MVASDVLDGDSWQANDVMLSPKAGGTVSGLLDRLDRKLVVLGLPIEDGRGLVENTENFRWRYAKDR
jgi:hypothetical protein